MLHKSYLSCKFACLLAITCWAFIVNERIAMRCITYKRRLLISALF